MNAKRTPLSGLGARLAKKPGETPEQAPAAQAVEEVPPARERAGDGRKGILVRARPEAWRALKMIALDDERTLQDVMTEAINDVLRKHGKPPVA